MNSIEILPIMAPGAKFNIQSAVADLPFSGSAPVALSCIHPVSSTPSFGQIVLFTECALTIGVDRSGPKEAINIIDTSASALRPDFLAPEGLIALFIVYSRVLLYMKRMLLC